MSVFQAILASAMASYGDIYDFALAHPDGFYHMGVIITLLMTVIHLFDTGWSKHTPWGFYLFAIVVWPVVLPVAVAVACLVEIWTVLSKLLDDEPDFVVHHRVVTHHRSREVTIDQMTREQEAAQLKQLQKLAGELRDQAQKLGAQAKLMEVLNLVEELRQALQKEKEKSAGDTPVSKDIETP